MSNKYLLVTRYSKLLYCLTATPFFVHPAYFVTICAHQRQCLFGDVVDGRMVLNQYGVIVADTYRWLCQRYPYLYIDEWIVMPNHFHAIMVIIDQSCMDADRNQ